MDYRDFFRRLAIGDPSFLKDIVSDEASKVSASGLDPKSAAFARLSASVAVGTSPPGYQGHLDAAFAAGATMEEIVGVLIAVGPTIGLAKLVLEAPAVALAAGYDTDAALERLDPLE